MAESLNIGALSRMTGIPADTLRTWERRYGFPAPERTSSGHRRYSLHTCDRLRQIRRLLDMGHRPSSILKWSDAQIVAALDSVDGELEPAEISGADERDGAAARHEIARWIDHCRSLAADELDRGFEQAWSRLAAIDMLENYVGPFLTTLGEQWEAQRLGIQHEHFVSHRLSQFLESKWRPLADLAQGPEIACATLSGEEHSLGLQLAATALVLADCRILYLGADLPADSLARASQQHRVRGVALSVSMWSDHKRTIDQLAELRAELGPIPVVVGGAGAPTDVAGIDHAASLRGLQRWARRLL
ncbi:MAG: MerR family transcriptional regulator [Myxococcales bacterium FL481]|nr:MAG: MerR family transcriptional regulator [Myxococcales bacterium FL481]